MENKYLILVNKNNPMKNESDYEIVECNFKYAENRNLEKENYEQFLKLKKHIKELGYEIDVESGYRSSLYQEEVWNECLEEHGLKHSKKFVAVVLV